MIGSGGSSRAGITERKGSKSVDDGDGAPGQVLAVDMARHALPRPIGVFLALHAKDSKASQGGGLRQIVHRVDVVLHAQPFIGYLPRSRKGQVYAGPSPDRVAYLRCLNVPGPSAILGTR